VADANQSSSTKKRTGKKANNQAQRQASGQSKGSVTPLMEIVRDDVQENTSGRFMQATLSARVLRHRARGKAQERRCLESPAQGARQAPTPWVPYHRFLTRSRSGPSLPFPEPTLYPHVPSAVPPTSRHCDRSCRRLIGLKVIGNIQIQCTISIERAFS
jgi:hypothetical protein